MLTDQVRALPPLPQVPHALVEELTREVAGAYYDAARNAPVLARCIKCHLPMYAMQQVANPEQVFNENAWAACRKHLVEVQEMERNHYQKQLANAGKAQ